MKAIVLILLCCSLFINGYAQQAPAAANTLDAAMAESMKKDKEKSDKDITDAKASTKAGTWMDRAKTYQSIAVQNIKLDSNAAMVAYEAYNKVVELDKDKKGGPGKLAKEATETLKSRDMYNAIMQQGVAKFQGKNYPEAVKLMTMAGDILPQDTLAPLYTAIGAQQIKDNATAKTQLEKYIANGGKDASIYGSLAMLYRNDKEIDKALVALDKGIAMAPTNKDLSNERINLMLASNRMDEAIAGMKQLVEKEPNNVQNIVNLGILYDNTAQKMSEEIRKLGGDAKQGGNNAAKKLTAEKDALSAINSEISRLTAKVKKEPKNAEAKRQLAEVQKRQADSKASVAQLETEAKEAANSAAAAGGNATKVAELKQKQAEQRDLAKQYYAKALAVDPANYDANYNMGVFFYNDAVEMKKAVDNMDMAEYNKRGKEVDGQVCGKFKQALPYFTKAKSVKEEAELNENLTNLQNILKQYEERKVVCVDSGSK